MAASYLAEATSSLNEVGYQTQQVPQSVDANNA